MVETKVVSTPTMVRNRAIFSVDFVEKPQAGIWFSCQENLAFQRAKKFQFILLGCKVTS